MQGKNSIVKLKFLNGLHNVLGFEATEFKLFDTITYESEHSPRPQSGIRSMYIYASICSPIQVDDTRVALLRSTWPYKNSPPTDALNIGDFQYISLKHPMYVNIASTCFNSIEVNIRTDTGSFVPFPEASITTMTLHFKKSSINNNINDAHHHHYD